MSYGLVGIDCGKSGAIAVLRPFVQDPKSFYASDVFDMPIQAGGDGEKSDYAKMKMALLLRSICDGLRLDRHTPIVVVESQQVMPAFSRHASGKRGEDREKGQFGQFHAGRGFGLWEGIIVGLQAAGEGLAYEEVSPKTWKTHMNLINCEKEQSLNMARAMFPEMENELKRKKDHNRAEALLLAEYARQRILPVYENALLNV